ncbi:hypothetical protein BDA99DRAFT_556157 [Phascolomyces articulosus]|uniref:F-box domain-containing protein n=1 Tax=Phascolomyces articulosus TaxID=60185 RepID=A0AAD5PIS1_9FUNG|nr:hypothetical protein BDA99DRAFT_556157 [Phascolomyces articulosus]
MTAVSTYKTIDQEIEESFQAVESDPKNPTFYIHAAKLYSCQGRQEEAISILNQGITMITQHDKNALLLKQQLAIVTERSERYVDFIAQGPYEIVFTIIKHFIDDQETRIACLDVSHVWRSKTLEHAAILWASMELRGTPPKKKQLMVVPIISKYVKNLNMYPGPRPGNSLSELLKSHDFSSLQTVSVTYKKGAKGIDYCHKQYIMKALSHIGHQLTGLDICVGKATHISIKQILLQCPRLESLKLDVYSTLGDDLNQNRTIVDTIISLTNIELITHSHVISLDTIESLFDYTPHLQRLVLYNVRSPDNIMKVLGDRCTKLVEIRVTSDMPDSINEIVHDKSRPPVILSKSTAVNDDGTTNVQGQQEGLQCLELHTYNLKSILPFTFRLEKCRYSLKKLSIIPYPVVNLPSPPLTDWEPLSLFSMYSLTVLSISYPCETFYKHLPSILPRFPALETFYLRYTHTSYRFTTTHPIPNDESTNDGIFDALAQLKNLTKVHLTYVYVNGQGFKRWLSKMIQQQERNQTSNGSNGVGLLRNLKLYRCEGLDLFLLNDMAMIHSLESFALLDFFDAWLEAVPRDDITIKRFQETLKTVVTTLPKLSKLELDFVPLTLDIVQKIVMESVESLSLSSDITTSSCISETLTIHTAVPTLATANVSTAVFLTCKTQVSRVTLPVTPSDSVQQQRSSLPL